MQKKETQIAMKKAESNKNKKAKPAREEKEVL